MIDMIPRGMFASSMGIEMVYSFIIIVCSLMIYFGTKELYELSSYKGIKYFRQSFLFFAIAYFFRSFIMMLLFLFASPMVLDISPRIFGRITLFLFMYFSAMAVFYLVYSIMWKEWSRKKWIMYVIQGTALFIGLVSMQSREPAFQLLINVFLLAFAAFGFCRAYRDSKKKKQKHGLYFAYSLLLVFWILNVLSAVIPRFLQQYHMIIYLASIFIFLMILYRVLRRVGPE
ncbi:MAG: hypothetical protein PHO02_03345 [Candidatus Nanoarchaeia archaeon]|nr:hypothetical protein [Candidatus Nanoarchaeia archaeon]